MTTTTDAIASTNPPPRVRAWPAKSGFDSRAEVLARVEAHRLADEVVQREGWDGERGCAIGCALHVYDHAEVARRIGIPEELAQLIDAIHEGLEPGESAGWPGRIYGAIAQDADLSDVCRQFKIRINRRNLERVGAGEEPWRSACQDAIGGVIAWLEGGCDPDDREGVKWSARSAAESAWSAARSAAWSAALSAAESAESAALSAAESAESAALSAALSAVRSAEYRAIADDLVEIVAGC